MTGKALEVLIRAHKGTIAMRKNQLKAAKAVAKTASLRCTNIQTLGKKVSLPAASKTRLKAAMTKVKEMEKLNKEAVANFDKHATSFTKLEKKSGK